MSASDYYQGIAHGILIGGLIANIIWIIQMRRRRR